MIPRWYNDTPGDSETFSARAPITHVQGDLVVKDVCGACNGGVLSALDGYGKELYDRYFATPVYADEAVHFDFDGDRLIRWLLKLSYNSARAQNADWRVLRGYPKVMLGESPLTDRLRCWLHLVTATYFDSTVKVARSAYRHEQGQPNVEEALWFRICQFRLPSCPALALVQRMVLINSFAFTLLIAPQDSVWPCEDFDQWITEFTRGYSKAKPVLPGARRITVDASGDHAATSIYRSLSNYPTRFAVEKNPYVVQALKGDLKIVFLQIPRDLINAGDTTPIAWALSDMVSTREKATAFKQRVGVMVDGCDDDPRALCQLPKVREYFRRLFVECPFVMLLAHPDGALLKLLAACWLYEDKLTQKAQRKRMAEFLNRAFRGLNTVCHRLALSEEQNREICVSAARVLFGEAPPIVP